MRLSISEIPFWSIIIIQLLSFFFLIFGGLSSFSSNIFFIIFILFELAIIGLGIYNYFSKKNLKKYFYYSWGLLFFICLFCQIVFNPEKFFQVEEVSITVQATLLFSLFFIVTLISTYIIFQERAIKKILLILASSTTIIVFLIVFFVMSEGIPAFFENDPVEFITGTKWQPFYEEDYTEYIIFETEEIPSDFRIYAESETLYIQPNSWGKTEINIENLGNTADSYEFSIDTDVKYNISSINSTIDAHDSKKIEIDFEVEKEGNYDLIFLAKSEETGNIKKIDFKCISSTNGVYLSPSKCEIFLKSGSENKKIPYKIVNLGTKSETYEISIETPENFRPSFSGVEWDYDTNSGSLTIGSFETVNLTLTPRLVKRISGEYYINITATSVSNPKITSESTINVVYTTNTMIDSNETYLQASQNNPAIFPINVVSEQRGQNFIFKIEIIQGNADIKLTHNESLILAGEGKSEIIFEDSVHEMIYLEIDPDSSGHVIVKLEAIREGTEPTFGILPFIFATILTTFIALLFAAPLGLGCAIYLAEFAPNKIRKILRPMYELLAGIPSVVYGLWGFMTFGPVLSKYIYPLITNTIGQYLGIFAPTNSIGRGVFTASIVLSIMILPIIITLSEDSIRSVRRSLKEGSLALGATRWQTMRKVILPKAKSGILTSIILATGRAIGETMAVLMIMGFTVNMVSSVFSPSVTMTGVVAVLFQSSFIYSKTRHALFAIGVVLFFMVFVLNIIISKINVSEEKISKSKEKKSILNLILPKQYIILDIFDKNGKKINEMKPVFEKKTILKKLFLKSSTEIKDYDEKLFSKTLIQTTIKAQRHQKVIQTLLISGALLVTAILCFILGDIFMNGGLAIRPEFFTVREIEGGRAGGFYNAIMGSIYLVAIAIGISAPLSIGAAIYIQEYAKGNSIIKRIILFTSDTLASTPSIIFGAFGFMFFVLYLDFQYSLLAGGITLAIMIIPLMLRSSVEAIKAIPREFQEGALAMGATKWQSIKTVVLPPAISGITSGVIISMGRAIGETAAILLTAGYALNAPRSILHQAASMPNLIFSYYDMAGIWPILGEKVYSSAFVLIIMILALNAIAKLIAARSTRMFKN